MPHSRPPDHHRQSDNPAHDSTSDRHQRNVLPHVCGVEGQVYLEEEMHSEYNSLGLPVDPVVSDVDGGVDGLWSILGVELDPDTVGA